MSVNWAADIRDMHRKFGFDGVIFNGEFLRFRQRFLEEELQELDLAIVNNDPESAIDALIDLCVVAIGTLDLGLGYVKTLEAWDIVHMANMTKERKENPTRTGSGGFDLIKPEGWKPPNYSALSGFGKFPKAIQQIVDELNSPEILERMIPSRIDDEDPPYIKILTELIPFARGKNKDYNQVKGGHARHYPHGIEDIFFLIHQKYVRIESLLEQARNGIYPENESLEDSFRDISIYGTIAMAWLRGKIVGQDQNNDMFNKPLEDI